MFLSDKGFYKLLSITFKNCETLNYFQGIPEAPVREERMEGTQAVFSHLDHPSTKVALFTSKILHRRARAR
jgi:hypothetical protein